MAVYEYACKLGGNNIDVIKIRMRHNFVPDGVFEHEYHYHMSISTYVIVVEIKPLISRPYLFPSAVSVLLLPIPVAVAYFFY